MENLLSDQRKFEKVTLKHDASLNFIVNQEKCIDAIFKNLVNSHSMSKEIHKTVKPVGTRPGTMCGLCKVHKQHIYDCPPHPHFGQFYRLYRLLNITLLSFHFYIKSFN